MFNQGKLPANCHLKCLESGLKVCSMVLSFLHPLLHVPFISPNKSWLLRWSDFKSPLCATSIVNSWFYLSLHLKGGVPHSIASFLFTHKLKRAKNDSIPQKRVEFQRILVLIHAIHYWTLNLKQDKLQFLPNHSALMALREEGVVQTKMRTNEIFKRFERWWWRPQLLFSTLADSSRELRKKGVRKEWWRFLLAWAKA